MTRLHVCTAVGARIGGGGRRAAGATRRIPRPSELFGPSEPRLRLEEELLAPAAESLFGFDATALVGLPVSPPPLLGALYLYTCFIILYVFHHHHADVFSFVVERLPTEGDP